VFARPGAPNPTVVNNAETLANVPSILREGAAWFRSAGTESSPGTMLFTVCGDVRSPGVYEFPLGIPLNLLLHSAGGGPRHGRSLKAVFPGASNAVISPDQFRTPLDFDAMAAIGSGLGSGGFIAYDDSACMVAATLALSRFLANESCGQCPACKQGTAEITQALERIERGWGSLDDLERIEARCGGVTGGQRCALPTGEARVVAGALRAFQGEFVAHLGSRCPRPRALPSPELEGHDDISRRFRHVPARPEHVLATVPGPLPPVDRLRPAGRLG
jgi:NADH:ubiquinone oxidoreductase subunit F (NADH-binding)